MWRKDFDLGLAARANGVDAIIARLGRVVARVYLPVNTHGRNLNRGRRTLLIRPQRNGPVHAIHIVLEVEVALLLNLQQTVSSYRSIDVNARDRVVVRKGGERHK